MKIEAILEDFSFLEIIHTAVNYQKTGTFIYEGEGGDTARIYLKEGQITHAVFGEEEGEETLVNLFFRDSGKVHFKTGEQVTKQTIFSDSLELIVTYAERVDNVRKIQKELPNPETVLVRSPNPERGRNQIDITLDQWQVLSLANGRRTIKDILHDSGKNEGLIKEMLVYLIEQGLLVNPIISEEHIRTQLLFLNKLLDQCRMRNIHGTFWDEAVKKHLSDRADENPTIRYVLLKEGEFLFENSSPSVCNKFDIVDFRDGIEQILVDHGNREYGYALMRYKLETAQVEADNLTRPENSVIEQEMVTEKKTHDQGEKINGRRESL
ncbi:MAG: hypothetical protein B6244_05410 [Candidatus Cloacimonetes bacterium 4572_55]|nr:MAG: hypothetical protein B6244_05410 [Candidatus Cloacimonetes bacterium 4572_55]